MRRMAFLLPLILTGCALFNNGTKLEQAREAQGAGDEAKAEELYREAIRQKGPDRDEAKIGLVSLLLARAERIATQDPDTALKIYRDVVSLAPESDQARISYARALMSAKQFDEALDVLEQGKQCRGCESMISVVFVEQAESAVKAGEFGDAIANYQRAVGLTHDPLTIMAMVDIYTQHGHGTGAEAVARLDEARRLLPIGQPGQQAMWVQKRTEVVYAAALHNEAEAIDQALALEDPRAETPVDQKLVEQLNLQMYAASLQIYQQQFDVGTQRGLATWEQAKAANLAEPALAVLRTALLELFCQRVAVHLANGEDAPAREMVATGRAIDPEYRTLALQAIIVTAMKNTGTARKMLSQWKDDAAYARMRALVETIYAQKMLGLGQLTAAATAVNKAIQFDPNLIETKLIHAELLAETRLPDLHKTWAEDFRTVGTYAYPGGRINSYGRSLAELRAAQALHDATASRDFLRGPSVGKRIAALDQRITAFYPFAVASRADASAALVLKRTDGAAVTATVKGPRKSHQVAVPENGQAELVLEGPGYVVVELSAGSRKALFAEPGITIEIAL